MKANNAGGLYNHEIGHVLASCERTEEAVPFLSESLAKIVAELCDTITGYMYVFLSRGDYASAEAILALGIGFFAGLRKENGPNFLDKVGSAFLAALAYAQFMAGREEAARASLREANELAAFFDASPSYDETDIRFISRIEGASAHDDIGATAADAVENVVNESESEAFAALWKEIKEKETDE